MTCHFLFGAGEEERELVWGGVDREIEGTASVAEFLALDVVNICVACAGVEMVMRSFVLLSSPGIVNIHLYVAPRVLPMHQLYPDHAFQGGSYVC